MIEFLLSFIILLLLVAGMALGVLRGRKPLSGSCGGLANLGLDGACEICGGNPEKCNAQDGDVAQNVAQGVAQNVAQGIEGDRRNWYKAQHGAAPKTASKTFSEEKG